MKIEINNGNGIRQYRNGEIYDFVVLIAENHNDIDDLRNIRSVLGILLEQGYCIRRLEDLQAERRKVSVYVQKAIVQ